ncbi:MAG TPA: DEAD/DEAH box helicase [Thermoanaerobaculia bacterium]|nr:DEAD/DEAH box helicase [Thermoanaerobaculia bacterium]
MELEAWVGAARERTLPPLRDPPPVRLMPHQEMGARRLVEALRRFGGALLLDEVGLGKSFTAATVARELAAEGWQIEACVPAPLVCGWERTFARFGVAGPIVTHDSLLRRAASGTGRRLLLVDEAHRFRNRATLRHRALEGCRSMAGLLLITATPVCNGIEDLLAIVRLAVGDDSLKPWGIASIDRAFALRDRRSVREIVAAVGLRRSAEIEGLPFPSLRRAVVRFGHGAEGAEVRRGIESLGFPVLGQGGGAPLMRQHLWRRFESSPEALVESLLRQRRFVRRAAEKLAAGFTLSRADFASMFDREDHGMFQEVLFPEAFFGRVEPAGSSIDARLEQELRRIETLLSLARRAGTPKVDLLEERLEGIAMPAVIFTRAVATARAVVSRLRLARRTASITSRGASDDRGCAVAPERVLAQFRARQLDLLVLTDLASEGLDLQTAASVVHYDLPWTAVKLHQRDGRARRIGQVRPEIGSVVFIPGRALDSGAMKFIARKERLSNRYLGADPFPSRCETVIGERLPALAARCGSSVVVVDRGILLFVVNGEVTLDPGSPGIGNRDSVSPCEIPPVLDRWREQAELMPPRCARLPPVSAATETGERPISGRRSRRR